MRKLSYDIACGLKTLVEKGKEWARLKRRLVESLVGLVGVASIVCSWTLGLAGPEAFIGLAAFGLVFGADEPTSGEPDFPTSRGPSLGEIFQLLLELSRPRVPPPLDFWGLAPSDLSPLPPIELPPPPPEPKRPFGPMTYETVRQKLEEEIAKRFREVLSGERPVSDIRLARRPPREETFSEKLMRNLLTPPPREETFSEKLARHLRKPPPPREETFSEKVMRHLRKPPPPREPTFTELLEQKLQEPEIGEAPQKKPDVFSKRLPLEGSFFYDAEGFSILESNVANFWSFLSRRYDTAVKMAGKFADRLKKERVVGPEVENDDLQNALQHFLASFTLTRDFESPSLVEKLGVLNERLLSSPGAWKRGDPREKHREDTSIDLHHNDLGIEWGKRYKGKEVSWDELYDLSRRLAKEGEFRY